MNKITLSTFRLISLVMPAMLGLTSCDTMNAFVKKDATATSMAKSSAEVPGRMDAVRQHDAEVEALVRKAEGALGSDDLDAAEAAYRELDALAPGNLRVVEGLRKVDARRRHLAVLEEAKVLLGKSEEGDARAAAKLRDILVENPDNTEARSLYKALLAKQEAKRAESMRKRLVYKNPVTLDFRDVSLKVIIEALAKGTGVNFILDKDVRSDQKATLFVNNVSLEDAVDMLIQSNQLQKKVLNEHSVIIYPNNTMKLREYQDLVIRSFFLEYADPKMVAGLLTTMLGIKQVQTDDRLPMIMIKDVPEIMVLAEKLIESQDVADPEVMLELEVIELTRNRDLDTGIVWPTKLSVLSPATGLSLDGLKRLGSQDYILSPSPSAVFKGTDSDVNLLANPRIRVKNKDKAKIHIGERVPIITSNVSSTGVISENVQYIDAGLKLEVEPTISLGGDVSIKLNLDVSSIGTSTTTKNGAVLYRIGTRSTATQLRLQDGETQVLAGLINDEDRKDVGKLPGLGDLPLVGRLFSNHTDKKYKTEILLSVTPHIVRDRKSPGAALAEYWSGSETQTGRQFTAPMTREGISKMFVPGKAPAPAPAAPATSGTPAATGDSKPQGLNIQLPPGLTLPPGIGAGTMR